MNNPFKGYDWHELTKFWNIEHKIVEYPEYNGKEPDLKTMKNFRTEDGLLSWSRWYDAESTPEYRAFMDEYHRVLEFNEKKEEEALTQFLFDSVRNHTDDKVAHELCMFIRRLYEESKGLDYQHPVWKALLEIEDNETLFKFTIKLLPMMWT